MIEHLEYTHNVKNKVNEVIDEVNIVKQVDTIADLQGLIGVEGYQVSVASYHDLSDLSGGGVFIWSSNTNKSSHNGGTIIDPSRVFPTPWGTGGSYHSGAGTAGTGCWIRQYDGAVNIKWFGAKGDGVTGDSLAITYAMISSKSVFIPEGEFFLNTSIQIRQDSQNIFGNGSSSKLIHTGGNTIQTVGFSYCYIYDLSIYGEGASGGIQINNGSKQVEIRDVYFYKGSQRVWLFECSEVTVIGCEFRECGYQVIQQLGYASSNCSVDNCSSYDCINDFVELNCEVNNPSKNWAIRNNNVFNVGTAFGIVQTESRFVGSTMVDGLIISGNYVDGVAGDSAIHLERYTHTVIEGNVFKNTSGESTIYLIPGQSGAPAGTEGRTDCIINGNQFITDREIPSYPTHIRSIDSTYYSKLTITNNQFTYFGSEYPTKPILRRQSAVSIGFLLQSCTIQNNVFKYLALGILCGENGGGAPSVIYPRYILNNTFEECDTAIQIDDDNDHPVVIDNNVFDNCGDSLSLLNYGDFSTLLSFSSNTFMNTPLDLTDIPISPKWINNRYQDGAVVTDARRGVTVPANTQTKVIKIPFGFVGILSVKCELIANGNNFKHRVYTIASRTGTILTVLHDTGGGVQPDFTITPTGTYGTYLEFSTTVDVSIQATLS